MVRDWRDASPALRWGDYQRKVDNRMALLASINEGLARETIRRLWASRRSLSGGNERVRAAVAELRAMLRAHAAARERFIRAGGPRTPAPPARR